MKAETKCSVVYYRGKNQDNTPDYPNILLMVTRTQRGYRVRDQENRETKRQRRTSTGRWVASKGNNLVNIDKDSGKGSKEGSKNNKDRHSNRTK